ncbi:MAG: dehypoxanthine futalosine cyclase [Candidatus Hydrogenedentes bacterium]|nr:dehypoxanthine futalosine cyclase [Candidatus Hydrogenedentota bacterium]
MPAHRLNQAEAYNLLVRAPLIELMSAADRLRRELHPGNEVTYVIDTNPNYTNVCITDCTFCSFYRKPGQAGAYTLRPEQVGERVALAQAQGATTVLLQGGHNPELGLAYCLEVIDAIKAAAPGIHLHLFSPAEIDHVAKVEGLTWNEVLQAFWDRGQRTMPGGGAEILVDRVRRGISPKKIKSDTWLDIMLAAHEIGYKTSATMTYGHRESEQDIIEHLFRLRQLQDHTRGFYAFIPWSFKPGNSPLSRLVPTAALPSYYLRVIAIARLVLDNFPHIQASWFGEGWRAGQLALHAGADDFGGLLLEENVLYQADHAFATTHAGVLNTIRQAGFTPVQRTTFYEKCASSQDGPAAAAPPVIKRNPGIPAQCAASPAN